METSSFNEPIMYCSEITYKLNTFSLKNENFHFDLTNERCFDF